VPNGMGLDAPEHWWQWLILGGAVALGAFSEARRRAWIQQRSAQIAYQPHPAVTAVEASAAEFRKQHEQTRSHIDAFAELLREERREFLAVMREEAKENRDALRKLTDRLVDRLGDQDSALKVLLDRTASGAGCG
jgi:hypothetical protein